MEIIQEKNGGAKLFTCKGCGSVIEANKAMDLKYWKDGFPWPMYECPKCHRANVDREELKKIVDSEEIRIEADATDSFQRRAKSWWKRLFGGGNK